MSAEKVRRNVMCGERLLGINRRFFRYQGIDEERCRIVYNALREGSLNDEDTIVFYKFVHPTRWGHCDP